MVFEFRAVNMIVSRPEAPPSQKICFLQSLLCWSSISNLNCIIHQIAIQTISIKSYYKDKMVDKLEYLDFCLIKCQILSIDNCFGCSDCYDKLVSFLLYWFRISVPKYVSIINLKHYNFKFLIVDMVFFSMDVW